MSILTRSLWISIAVACLVCCNTGNGHAGEPPGTIQIHDSIRPVPESQPLPVSNGTAYGNTYIVGPVQNGPAVTPASTGFLGAGPPLGEPGTVWLPNVHPVQRTPVVYQRYWPRKWYGMPGGGIAADAPRAPVVYMPTDTTQMGFYYQRAPRWQPRPGMLPPPPNPWSMHQYTRPPNGAVHFAPASPASPRSVPPSPEQKKVSPPVPKQDLDKSAVNYAGHRTVR